MPLWTPDRPLATDAGMNDACPASRQTGDEWLWGWDPTPGIVSVWADQEGRALVWRRITETDELVLEQTRFRPWLLLDRLDDLRHLPPPLPPQRPPPPPPPNPHTTPPPKLPIPFHPAHPR